MVRLGLDELKIRFKKSRGPQGSHSESFLPVHQRGFQTAALTMKVDRTAKLTSSSAVLASRHGLI